MDVTVHLKNKEKEHVKKESTSMVQGTLIIDS